MSEFLASPLFLVLLVFLASIVSVVGGGLLGKWLLTKKQGYPNEEQIEAALLPFVRYAIIAAYKVSEQQVDTLGDRLRGIDKKLVAMSIYNILPDEVRIPLPGGGVLKLPTVFIKQIVSEEDFSGMIEGVFGELEDFLESTQGEFGEAVEELLKELK